LEGQRHGRGFSNTDIHSAMSRISVSYVGMEMRGETSLLNAQLHVVPEFSVYGDARRNSLALTRS
jgi:hypothetical protein